MKVLFWGTRDNYIADGKAGSESNCNIQRYAPKSIAAITNSESARSRFNSKPRNALTHLHAAHSTTCLSIKNTQGAHHA